MISSHVYNEIREKFTEETADMLISTLESKPATKDDLINFSSEIRTEMRATLTEFKTDIRSLLLTCTWLLGILISLAVVIIKFA